MKLLYNALNRNLVIWNPTIEIHTKPIFSKLENIFRSSSFSLRRITNALSIASTIEFELPMGYRGTHACDVFYGRFRSRRGRTDALSWGGPRKDHEPRLLSGKVREVGFGFHIDRATCNAGTGENYFRCVCVHSESRWNATGCRIVGYDGPDKSVYFVHYRAHRVYFNAVA